ncbi:FAS1 domain-containing protein [Glonium stellatum]|uniref:FAS1 domain-containing protein n=1 Tax=Glonium stellatum TaxID=574774 RepID=A0A8E2EST4_9PEZI|nr:FAS1 domain-containing protein [Glonium stellatum]
MSLVTLWASFFAFAHAVDLFTALRDAGAAQFAQQIQADPSLVAIFTKPSVHTVFAPLDDAVNPNTTVFNRLLRRGNPPPGAVDTCDEQTTASNSASKRRSVDTDPFFPCVGNTCAPSWSSVSSTTPFWSSVSENSSGVELFSGLGNNVTIAQANIPYDHGRIHTLHGYLTNPESLMDTLAAKNLTSFASGIKSTNLTSVVSNPSPVGVTVFVPFNEAYNAGISPNASTSSLFTALSNHIVPNYLGLSPWLTNGTVLVTEAKTTLTVTIREGKYFINDAMIVAADLITTNGVAHVIDKVFFYSLNSS